MRYIAVIVVCCLIGIGRVAACTCIGKADVREEHKQASIVVVGTVVAEELMEVSVPHVFTGFQFFMKRYTVEVERSFKGRKRMTRLVIVTGRGGGDCGVVFEVGQRYVLYAARDGHEQLYKSNAWMTEKDVYWTSICTRTRAYDEAEVRALELLK